MIVYVESNFVQEVALLQEEHQHCLQIIELCRQGLAHLTIPAYCLAEPHETRIRRHKDRMALKEKLAAELRQLSRTQTYQAQTTAMDQITAFLIRSTEEETARLASTVNEVLAIANVIPLTKDVLTAAMTLEKEHGLRPQDSIVYASIVADLEKTDAGDKCFLNKNSKDFDDPDIVAALTARNCTLLARFESGLGYIQSQLSQPPSKS